MKLIRFGEKGNELPGVIFNGQRRDCSARFRDWDREFFQGGGLEELAGYLRNYPQQFRAIDEDQRWAAPVGRPGSIICVGLNFSDHAKESGMEIPAEPILFMKASNTISGPYDPVSIPPGSEKTDWEIELGVVLGKDAYLLEGATEAESCIAGYTIVHDISERSYQLERGGQWVKGKSCPGFSPVGPWLLTSEEMPDPSGLSMQLDVNDQTMQSGSSATMVFQPAYLVWYISQFMLLEAGDLITTGTPPGVGLAMKPPVYLKKGDEVRLSIDHLGEQRQKFI